MEIMLEVMLGGGGMLEVVVTDSEVAEIAHGAVEWVHQKLF